MAFNPNYANIPLELREKKQWVCWRAVKQDNGKTTKVPYNPLTRRGASTTNLKTWVPYASAVKAVQEYSGIGFVFNNDYVGVDLDHVIRDDGTLEPEAAHIVDMLDSYTEYSPSRRGLHIICRGDIDIQANKVEPYEMYRKKRFFTFSGDVFEGHNTINDRPEQLRHVHNEFLLGRKKQKPVGDGRQDYEGINLTVNNYNTDLPDNQAVSTTYEYKTDADYLRIGLEKDKKSKFIAFWNRDPTVLCGDESRDDLSFANYLAFWANRNPEVMRDAFLSSPYFAGKDDAHKKKIMARGDYLSRRVIDPAIQGCGETARDKDMAHQADCARKRYEEAKVAFAPLQKVEGHELTATDYNGERPAEIDVEQIRKRIAGLKTPQDVFTNKEILFDILNAEGIEPGISETLIFELKDRALTIGISRKEFNDSYKKFKQQYHQEQAKTSREAQAKQKAEAEERGETPSEDTWFEYNEEGRKIFKHAQFAEYVIQKYHVIRLNTMPHVYVDGVYERDNGQIQTIMNTLIRTSTIHQRNEAYAYMQNMAPERTEEDPGNYILFANGIYDISSDALTPCTPDRVFLQKIPHNYNPEAVPNEEVIKTISEIADGDRKIIDLFYEVMGFCLFRENPAKKFFVIQSIPNGGKTTLLNIIAQMLSGSDGSKNHSTLLLSQFGNRFDKAQIYGKLANLGDDIKRGKIDDEAVEVLNILTGGGGLTLEWKGKDGITYQNKAKMIFTCNEVPKTIQEGFIDRMVIIPLKHTFTDSQNNNNTSLKNKKWNENAMETVVRNAVEGLRRILKNPNNIKFSEPDSVKAAKGDYRINVYPIQAFVTEQEEIDGIEGQWTHKVEANYKNFCDGKDIEPLPFTVMVRQICALGNYEACRHESHAEGKMLTGKIFRRKNTPRLKVVS